MRNSAGKRRHCPFTGPNDTHQVSYKRFRRRIIQRGSGEGPAASTPLPTGCQCVPSSEFNTVCQRLELDSPPRPCEPAQSALQRNLQATPWVGRVSDCEAVKPHSTPCSVSGQGWPTSENAYEQRSVWRAAIQGHDNTQQAGSDKRRLSLQPFAVLEKVCSLQGKSAVKLGAPSLLNDYYTNLLDCSCNGMIALALGSSVYLWNSETHALVGYLDLSPNPGQLYQETQSVSSLCWSRDGRALCIGTRQGQTQLWDVEHKQNIMCLPSHLSVVRAFSWKQHLLSSGSILGCIHHLDPRAPTPLVGAAVQEEGICSLQWSPGDDWLASGSTDGLLHIWNNDIAGHTKSHQPITTMKQPSSVKDLMMTYLSSCKLECYDTDWFAKGFPCSCTEAMGWCPWQRKMIATGGGWKDGELRIWDTQMGTCVTSVNTNSQICSLRWAEKKRYVVTGHGLPHHQVRTWEFPSLSLSSQLTGHSRRVLHLAVNPECTQIFSAGADQCFQIWDL